MGGLLFLNNCLGAIFLIILAIAMGEERKLGDALASLSWRGCFSALLSCIVGICIGYAGIATHALISATSFMVLTNVNKLAVIAFGIFVMGDVSTVRSTTGCFIAVLGGVWYAKSAAPSETETKVKSQAHDPAENSSGFAETVGIAEAMDEDRACV